MKIALIAPPYPLEEIPSPPLGLTYIAAACEASGADVTILDYIVRGYSDQKLVTEIDALAPDVVGINSVTLNFKKAAAILRAVKQARPDIITLFGGPHVSFDSKKTLAAHPEIDIIVKGEGEATIAELLPVIHDRDCWHRIKGIVFKDRNRLISTGRRPFIRDLDTLPLPARHLLPMARYQALGYPVSIITSRGCPNQCIFCLGRRMVGHKVRFRSIRQIVDEIEILTRYGIFVMNIADDLFTVSRRRVRAFCAELDRRNLHISWSAFSRVNTIDAETLTLMKNAGCHGVSFGIESGNPEMLKRVKKGITIDQAKNASTACQLAGIRGHASFMVGLPGETLETMNDSLALQQELEIESAYHFLAPFPGTAVRENIAEYDLEILTNDWDAYHANQSIVRTSSLSPEQMDAFVYAAGEPIRKDWEALKQRYAAHTATPYEQMQVGGHYRTQMIFALLSQDILETWSADTSDPDSAQEHLCAHVSAVTDLDLSFVRLTLQDLMNKGYIHMKIFNERICFSWSDAHKPSASDTLTPEYLRQGA